MNISSILSHGWQNVTGVGACTLSLSGMLLVFFSLSIISTIIGLTPYLLKFVDRFYPETEEEFASKKSAKTVSESEIAAAVATALIHSIKTSNM